MFPQLARSYISKLTLVYVPFHSLTDFNFQMFWCNLKMFIMKDAAQRWVTCLVVIFSLSTFITAKDTPDKPKQESDDEYGQARKALKALIHLMKHDVYKSAMSDDMVHLAGVTMAIGQFEALLSRPLIGSIPTDLTKSLMTALMLGEEIIDSGKPATLLSVPDYFENMQLVVREGLFEREFDPRMIDANLKYPKWKINNRFTENVTEDCLSNLKGTGITEGKKCSVSIKCWTAMTAPNYDAFSLTHQILYLLFGHVLNCDKRFAVVSAISCRRQKRCKTAPQLQEIMCANAVLQMKRLDGLSFTGPFETLFLEQFALCGALGFKDVCTPRWLDMIVSWQNKNGCYTKTESFLNPGRHIQEHLDDQTDCAVSDRCDPNKTSLAAGALAMCVRIHLEDQLAVSSGTA